MTRAFRVRLEPFYTFFLKTFSQNMIPTEYFYFSRIAHQQEIVRNFSVQGPPKPIPAPQKTISKPLDLTSSLLASNLNQLAKPLPSSASHPNNQQTGSSLATPTYSTPSMVSNYSYQSQFSGFDVLSTASAGPVNFNNKWANNPNNQAKVKQDWSAFESLLPTANNNATPNRDDKKLTDNEMMDLLR